MSKKILIVTAHPDDETIFFGGLLQQRPSLDFRVVCATSGNADGQGHTRIDQFEQAMHFFGISDYEVLCLADIYEQRLDLEVLTEKLSQHQDVSEIYTHGILGEYGHPHHQDVSYCVHKHFHKTHPIWSVAYNCFPDQQLKLTAKQYQLKSKILSEVYLSETKRFVNLIPSYWSEGFASVKWTEVSALYKIITHGIEPDKSLLEKYAWYLPYLKEREEPLAPRPF